MPSPPKMHWSPVEPSWIVSIGMVILAVLPHQIPAAGRHLLQHPNGSLLFAAVSAVVAWKKPTLGMAMFILLAGVVLSEKAVEQFAAMVLNKDSVQRKRQNQNQNSTSNQKHRWYEEEVLSEDPHGIQERTENPILNYDEVTEQESEPWFGERTLNETPEAIQEKPVGTTTEYDDDGSPRGH
jgi:hypothetical protein